MATTLSLILPIFLLVVIPSSALSQSNQSETFIVHVAQSHKPSVFSSHRHWYASLLRSLSSSSHSPSILYTYCLAAAGFSAHLSHSQAAELSLLPAVLSVLPDQPRRLHTTHTPHFLGLADSSGLWPNSDYADDVIVGVLDTGIWPDRPSFDDAGLSHVSPDWKGICQTSSDFPPSACNRKIIGARAFYRGYEAAIRRPMDESVESKSPRDTEGHGTHTASTAAGSRVRGAGLFEYAKGEARGMAAKARIAVYKICWGSGCYDSDILAAMEQAISDGVHVISLSVGASGYAPQYFEDSIAIGAFGAAEHGVLVSCSAGNSGPGPYTAVNIAPWILTVGASTVDREFPADVVLGDGRIFGGVSLYSGQPLTADLPLVYAGDCGSSYCYAQSLDPAKVAGKIVICDRGGNARVEKGSAVKQAGGAGMILANTEENGEELIADSHLIPATMVGDAAGRKIREYAGANNSSPTATIVFRGTVIGTSPSAPRIAAFSSRGPSYLTPEILKPDVIAPGVNILAAWTGFTSPTDLDIDPRRVEFNIISGTSMSCPHVSGLAALLRKAYPKWGPAALKSALMTTAYNLDNSGRNITDLATGGESTPFVRGAGHVDPNRALNPGLVYDVGVDDYVAFLCAIGYDSQKIGVFVRGPASVDCGAREYSTPGDLNYPSFSVLFGSADSVVKQKRRVTNVGGGDSQAAVYEVKVRSPPSVEISVSPTQLVFSGEVKTASYEVTFASVRPAGTVGNSGEFGSIEWSDGVHAVRSPVAVRWLGDYYLASSV